jgi:virginiamycin B lyase
MSSRLWPAVRSFVAAAPLALWLAGCAGAAPAAPPAAVAQPTGAFVVYDVPSPGAFPMGLAQAPDGSVWFVESFLGRLGHLANGTIREIDVPHDDALLGHVAVDAAGNVWADYADRANVRGGLLRLEPNGRFTAFRAAPRQAASMPAIGGLTLGSDGAVWFTEGDAGGASIGRIDRVGRLTQFPLPSGEAGPLGIVPGPDGNIWFGGANRIGRISTAGVVLGAYPVPIPAVAFASDPQRGLLWFVDSYSNIGHIDARGTFKVYTEGYSSNGLFVPEGPVGIAVAADDSIWIGESNFGTIGKLALAGTLEHYLPPSVSRPWGVLPQSGGKLYVTDFSGDRLYLFDPAAYVATAAARSHAPSALRHTLR